MTALEREKLGEWLSAYVDGELNSEQNTLIERLIEEDDEVRRRLEEMRSVSRMVFDLPRHAAPPSIMQDIRRQTERDALLGDAEEDRASVPGQSRFGMRLLATAAMVAVVATGALLVYRVLPGRSLAPDTALVSNTPKSGDDLSDLMEKDSLEDFRSKDVATSGAAPGRWLAEARFGKRADLATLEQKISRLAATEELVNHPFTNEANTLTLTFATDRDRDKSFSALTEQLRAASVNELVSDGPSSDARRGGVFIEGRVGVNFVGRQDQQVLVHLRKNQVESLVREIDSAADVDIRMQVGPLGVRGRGQVMQLARAISRGDFAAASNDLARPARGYEAEALSELFKSLSPTKRDDRPSPDDALETTAADGHTADRETATLKKNGVSLPGGAIAGAPSGDGAPTEDSPIVKSNRRARRERRVGRSTRAVEAQSTQTPPPSADADTFAEKEATAPGEMAKPARREQKVEPKTDSRDQNRATLPVLPDRPPLAARRLADARRNVATAEAAALLEVIDSASSDADSYVTLVIQLVSRESARPRALSKPAPAKVKPSRKPAEKGKTKKPQTNQ